MADVVFVIGELSDVGIVVVVVFVVVVAVVVVGVVVLAFVVVTPRRSTMR